MNKIKRLLEWEKTEDANVLMDVDCDKYFFEPLLKALGDDINEILKYLNHMDDVPIQLSLRGFDGSTAS